MTTYAVTGATGPFGRLAVAALLDRGVPAADVVAVVRTPAAVAASTTAECCRTRCPTAFPDTSSSRSTPSSAAGNESGRS